MTFASPTYTSRTLSIRRSIQFHVTDSIKFRGEDLTDRLNADILRISAACLADEITLLQPSAVVFTSMALDALKLLAQPWNLPAARLLPLVNKTSHRVVPHWKKRGAASAWTAVLKRN